jgi:hypothetical protein
MDKKLESIRLKLGSILWLILIGIAWVACVFDDVIWSPIWWFFNKKKFIKK